MTVEEAVRARLLSLPAVTALVSTRIYMQKLKADPIYPCVRVTLVSDPSDYHLRGESGFGDARVQVDAFAHEVSGVDPYALAVAVAAAIDGDGQGSGLSGYVGSIGSPAFYFDAVFRVDRRPQYDPEELRVLTMSQDFRIHYRN